MWFPGLVSRELSEALRYVILNANFWGSFEFPSSSYSMASSSSGDSSINGYFFCLNVNIVSMKNMMPLMMETTPLAIAKSRVLVLNSRSHDWMMKMPDVRNKTVPRRLYKSIIRLLIVAFIKYPAIQSIVNTFRCTTKRFITRLTCHNCR